MQLQILLKKVVYPLLLFALFYFFYDSFKNEYVSIFTARAVKTQTRIHLGDSTKWRLENFDDSKWDTKLPKAPYFAWMRIWIDLDTMQIQDAPIGLGLWSYTGSYDLFWDGNFVGSNGTPGKGIEEIPGQIDKIFHIPDSLLNAGRHLISLRASQQRAISMTSQPYLIIENYDTQSQYLIKIAALIHIITGAFFIISIYYFFVYFKSYRQRVFLIFAIICLLLFFGSLFHFIKFYYKYPYPFHLIRRTMIEGLTMFLGISLSAYFLFLYNIKRSGILLLGLSLVFILTFLVFHQNNLNIKIYILYTEGVLFSLILTLWAVIKGRKYSMSSLFSLMAPVTLLFFLEIYFYSLMVYISFFVFIVFNLYTLSKTIGAQKKEYEKYLVESNRLKVELLKKNIQPHFIMNTLTSLISWVEESPTVAVKFIEALADEFRILVEIAEYDKIPVPTEIKLCESHMKVMSYRHEVEYRLEFIDIDPNLYIPPAIFLTLLENGITHNMHDTDVVVFELQLIRTSKGLTYRFFSPGIVQKNDTSVKDGTGIKYIKARLNELYGKSWDIESFQSMDGWETKIMLFK